MGHLILVSSEGRAEPVHDVKPVVLRQFQIHQLSKQRQTSNSLVGIEEHRLNLLFNLLGSDRGLQAC